MLENNIEDRQTQEPTNIKDLKGFIEVLDAAPTHTPKNFYESLKFYNGALYAYDQVSASWIQLYGYTSPLSTKGDIFVRGASDTRLPVGTNGYFLQADSTQTTGLKWADLPETSVAIIETEVTAGENIDGTLAPLGVFVADDNTYSGVIQNLAKNAFKNDSSSTKWYAQTFTTPASPYSSISLVSSKFSLKKSSGATGTLSVKLYATSSGLPTGSALATDTLDISTLSDVSYSAIEFDLPYSLSAGTKYVIVLELSLSAGSLLFEYKDTDVYSGGDALVTSNSGSNWSLFSTAGVYHDLYFDISYTYKFGTEGYIYKSDPDDVARNKYHGIVKTSINASAAGNMIVEGAVSGFSSLEPGELYYIQNDQTAGLTVTSLLLGRAVKADTINIIKQGGSNVYLGAVASDVLRESADTERTLATGGTNQTSKLKEFIVPVTGYYRIKFDLRDDTSGYDANARIYRNGTAYGTSVSTASTSYVNYSEDLFFVAGDLAQLYITVNYGGTNHTAYTRNFRVYYSIGEIPVDNFPGLISLD